MKNVLQFIRAKLIEYKKIKSIKTDREIRNYWVMSWFVYSVLYPILRIFITKKGAITLCDKMINSPFPQIREGINLKDKSDWNIFIEVFLRDVYRKNILKNNMIVIDVGAHIGIYSVLASQKTKKVIAIEPDFKNYERLKENTVHLKNVTTKNIALSNRSGDMPFYISEFSSCHSLNVDIAKEIGNCYESKVSVSTLDNLLEEMDVKRVDVIKIDAEGEELNILRGSEKTLKNNPEAKIIVASYHYPQEKAEVVNFLSEKGFKIKIDEIDIIITE